MRLIWSRPARDDLFQIAEYYEAIDPALAVDMLDRVRAAVSPLLSNPEIGSPIGNGAARKWRVPRTPYLSMYILSERDIEVRRVHHAASDWQKS